MDRRGQYETAAIDGVLLDIHPASDDFITRARWKVQAVETMGWLIPPLLICLVWQREGCSDPVQILGQQPAALRLVSSDAGYPKIGVPQPYVAEACGHVVIVTARPSVIGEWLLLDLDDNLSAIGEPNLNIATAFAVRGGVLGACFEHIGLVSRPPEDQLLGVCVPNRLWVVAASGGVPAGVCEMSTHLAVLLSTSVYQRYAGSCGRVHAVEAVPADEGAVTAPAFSAPDGSRLIK
jgi:hypothetical protein